MIGQWEQRGTDQTFCIMSYYQVNSGIVKQNIVKPFDTVKHDNLSPERRKFVTCKALWGKQSKAVRSDAATFKQTEAMQIGVKQCKKGKAYSRKSLHSLATGNIIACDIWGEGAKNILKPSTPSLKMPSCCRCGSAFSCNLKPSRKTSGSTERCSAGSNSLW